jgi:hypothetical protein
LFYKKRTVQKKIFNKFFFNINKIYEEKRPEDKIFIKDVLISKITDNLLKEFLETPAYEY